MKIAFTVVYTTLVISLITGLNGCKTVEPVSVDPVVTTPAAPSWTLNPDLILDNKLLLAAHANEKRLVVAGTEGFFQLNAGDTTFVKNGTFGRTIPRFGVGGSAAVGFSMFTPLLSDNLYASLSADRKIVGLSFVGDSTGQTQYYTGSGAGIYPDIVYPTLNLTITGSDFRSGNGTFGSFNMQKNVLLLHSSQGVILLARNDNTKEFALLRPVGKDYPEFLVNNYTLKPIALPLETDYKSSVRTSIAVNDYFVATPGESLLASNTYLYAIYTDGTVKKIPKPAIIPDKYFYYKGKLYGYQGYNGTIGQSMDGGFTWKNLLSVSFSGSVEFVEIDGKLVAYGQSQILLLDDGTETFSTYDPNTKSFYQLINAGLDGNKITGLTRFGKKVYATTLSGLYQINLTDFFTKATPSK